jgi:hypothetical protein
MTPRRMVLALLAAVGFARPQVPDRPAEIDPARPRLPKTEDLLKAEHKRSVEDAGKLLQLAEDLKIEIEKNDRHVLSISAIKKTEEIERLAKRIRDRMRRY